jgi:hypothetical protein
VVVISIVHNEEDLIVPLLEHYFALRVDAVWLLDNDCTDATLDRARNFSAVTVTSLDTDGQLDDLLRRDAFERCRAACAGRFDWVVLVDADEFLVPREGEFKATLARYPDRDVLGSEGYDVVQGPGEAAFNPSAAPLAQRRWGIPNSAYGKPVVLRPGAAVRLAVGHHYLEGLPPYPRACPFLLFHLAGFDEAIFLKRRRQMVSRQGARNAARGFGLQYRGVTEDDLRRQWSELRGNPSVRRLPSPWGPNC